MMPIKEYLETIQDAFTALSTHMGKGDQHSPVYELLLTHGRDWIPMARPKRYRKGIAKRCFRNAALLALKYPDELTYVEGYGYSNAPMPLAHAWCIDREGKVIDTTWKEPEQCHYFGIPFKLKFVRSILVLTGYYGILDNRITAPPSVFLETRWAEKSERVLR